MTPTGAELSSNSAEKSHVSDSGGAESGAVGRGFGPELAKVVHAWPRLSEADRRAIVAIVDGQAEQR